MPTGIRSHIMLKKEAIWGTPDGVATITLPFISESITPDIEEIMSESQRAVVDEPVSLVGESRFGGDIVMEVHPASIGHILRSALGAPAAGVAAGTAELVLENCEDVWVGNSGVVVALDSGDYKKGSRSVKITVPAGIAAGTLLATEDFDAVDMTADTHIKLWIKCSGEVTTGQLEFLIDEQAACAGPDKTLNIGALAAGVWTEVTMALGTMTDENAVISVGLKYTADLGECVINIDDVRRLVTTAATTAKDHVFTPVQADFATLCTLPPYTLEVYRDQVNDKAWQYKGAVVNTLALSFGTGGKILKATVGVLAKEEAEIDKQSVNLETTNPFTWNQAVVKIATVQHDLLEDFTLNLDNKIVRKFSINQSSLPRMFYRDGYRTFGFTFTTDFVDKVEYNKFLLGTEQAFQIVFTGAVTTEAGYYYKFQIDIPAMHYIAYPINVSGPGRLSVKVIGKAKYSISDGYAAKITLTNVTASY